MAERSPKKIKEDLEAIIEAKRAFENEASRSFDGLYESVQKQKQIEAEIRKLKSEQLLFTARENDIKKELESSDQKIVSLAEKKLALLNIEKEQTEDMIIRSEGLLKVIDKQAMRQELVNNKYKEAKQYIRDMGSKYLKEVFDMINEVDGAMKKLNLTHGITNDFSKTYGVSLTNIAAKTAQIGVSGTDLVSIQNEYINQTGKLSQLNEKNFEDISLIGKGTGMGVEAAAKMVGQFDLLGYGIAQSKEIIEETVNNVGKYGISSGKLLDKVNANLGKLNTMNFKNGVKGLIEMTKLSERFKMDMSDTFAAMDKSRTLEGSIDMAAKLMVMGGNFAKADPFKLSFLSRNDPAKFTEELVKMNKGIASFNGKEFVIGAYDLDRLRIVAEATGRDFEKLSESVKQTAQFDLAKSKLFTGTEKQKDMIATMAKIGKGGKFSIDLGGKHFDDISKLTATDMQMLEQQNKTLENRAKDSQTFDDLLKNVILEMKATFLPLLKFTSIILEGIKGMVEGIRNLMGGTLKPLAFTLGGIMVGAHLWIKAAKMWTIIKSAGGFLSAVGNLFTTGSMAAGGAAASKTTQTALSGSQALGAGKGAMFSSLGTAASLAAIGVAAVGIGYGLKLAADGFSNLAKSVKELNPDQTNTLLLALGGTVIGFGVSLGIAGAIASATWYGLLAVGATAIAIGGGIALAASQIGFALKMGGEAFSAYENAKNAGVIAEANAKASFAKSMSTINFAQMDSAFKEANAFISSDSSKIQKLKKDLETLSKSSFGDMINQLSNTMSKGVEMRLAKDAQLVIHNVLEVDGKKIIDKDNILKFSIVKQADINKNKTNVPM